MLKDIFFLLDDGDRRLFGEFNLSVSRFYILWHLGNEPGISSSQLSDRMICDKSNITRLSKGLEADGLVVRQPHESDGRALRLFLTEEGEAVRAQALDAHLRYNNERFSCCSEEEQSALQQLLLGLRDSLSAQLYAETGENSA
ncbi:MAG: MarR family transcriptional regulator [Anaerolineales bacterium]|nr:MarR family transcriptional regulator [Anaerolineales bacterium]